MVDISVGVDPATGQPHSSTHPAPVKDLAGSTGLDFSVGQPTLPVVGANFAGSGPYANYVLLKTLPASTTRAYVEIMNNSGSEIVVIRDDGTATTGAAPANASVFALDPGVTIGQQGGTWSSRTFRGRLQIYGPTSGLQIAIMID